MAALKVGQRVRFLKAIGLARQSSKMRSLDGREAVVWELGPYFDEPRRAARIKFADGFIVGVMAHQVVPILPDGHRPAELSVEELLPFLSGVSA